MKVISILLKGIGIYVILLDLFACELKWITVKCGFVTQTEELIYYGFAFGLIGISYIVDIFEIQQRILRLDTLKIHFETERKPLNYLYPKRTREQNDDSLENKEK